MQSENIPPQQSYTRLAPVWLEVSGQERWAMYNRLQSLQIDCRCRIGQPLRVPITSVQDFIQCWSVARHTIRQTQPRSQLVAWLQQCWSFDTPCG